MGPVIAGHLADPAVSAATVDQDGRLRIERVDGRTVEAAAPVPRREVERIVAVMASLLGRRPGDRRPIVAEDPEADLVATALPSDGIVAPLVSFARIAPPRLGCWVAAGRLGDSGAGRLRDLLRDGANVVVAAHAGLARRRIVRTLLVEATALGQRIVHVQEHERFHTGTPGIVAIAALAGVAALRGEVEALAGRLNPDRLVFSAQTIVAEPWLLDRAAHRRPPCIVSMHARRPGEIPGRLARLAGMAARGAPARGGLELIDAVVFTTAPGASWQLMEFGGARGRQPAP